MLVWAMVRASAAWRPLEGAPFQHQDLASGVANLLGRSADDAHGETHLIRDAGGGQAGPQRHRCDDVVPACVPDNGEGIVLGTDAQVKRAATGPGDEGGGKVAHAGLHFETAVSQGLGQPRRGLHLLVAQLGIGVDSVAQLDQGVAHALDLLSGNILGVHGCLLA